VGKANYRTAGDGHRAREAPSWTEEKLMVLECYLEGFARASSSARGWYGLDLFAGAGLNYSLAREREIPSSPIIMLEAGPPVASEISLCEMGRTNRMALEARVGRYGERARVFAGDANKQVQSMLERVLAD